MLNKVKITFTLLLFSVLLKPAMGQKYSEYEVKLAYLYQIVRYVNWPTISESEGDFVMGFYGDYDFGDLPERMYSSRKFKNKDCKVIDVKTIEQAKQCNVIFIVGVKKFDALNIIKAVEKYPVLTVGDELNGFCKIGGMINFTDKSERMRIELCVDNVDESLIEISKQLHSIAKLVKFNDAEF
jgi:hypothetical protein